MWNKDVNLGEMVGNKHAFYSAMFINGINQVLGYTYNGSFYLWKATEGNIKQLVKI